MNDSDSWAGDLAKFFALPSLVIFKYRFPYISFTRRQFVFMFLLWLPVLYGFYIYIYESRGDQNPYVWPLPATIFLLVCIVIGFYHWRDAKGRWKEEHFTKEDYPPKSRLVQYFGQFFDEESANRYFDPVLTAIIGILILWIFNSSIGAILIISAGAQLTYFKYLLYSDEDKRRHADWLQRVHREDAEKRRSEVLGTPTIYDKERKHRPVEIAGGSTTKPRPRIKPAPVETSPVATEKSAWQKELERRAQIIEAQAKDSSE